MNKEHFYFDGYSLNTDILANEDIIKNLANAINERFFNSNGKIVLIPYFDGKIKEDGGISVIVMNDNMHFTCHTFCYKNALFIDYYGNKDNFDNVFEIILKYYPTDDYDLCVNNKDIPGRFGKHIIYDNIPKISYDEGIELIKKILKDINMTPIMDTIKIKKDDYHYDLLQPIAESHISIHQNGEYNCIDVFSCKYFDEKLLCKLLNCYEYKEINRGIKYQ